MAHADLPEPGTERTVEASLTQQVAGLLERPALGQGADEDLDRTPGEHVDVLVEEVQRQARVVLGLGHPPGAERQI